MPKMKRSFLYRAIEKGVPLFVIVNAPVVTALVVSLISKTSSPNGHIFEVTMYSFPLYDSQSITCSKLKEGLKV